MKDLFNVLLVTVLAFGIIVFAGFRESYGATLVVNDFSDAENCDNLMSLREAIDIEQGNLTIIPDAVFSQIIETSGLFATLWVGPDPHGCGAGVYWWVQGARNNSHKINFAQGSGLVHIATPLPPIRFNGAEINGRMPDGNIVTIDGSGTGVGVAGLSINDRNVNFLNMQIQNFGGDGIICDSCDNSLFRGLIIHNNGGHGISIKSTFSSYGNPQNDIIGGTASDQGNIIFSNGGDGIRITADLNYDRFNENISILNNRIGTSNGLTAAGNGGRGITLQNAFGVTIGDPSGQTKNTISGNNNDGIAIEGSGSVSNLVIWNNIGTDINGNNALGNAASGISFLGDAGSGANFTSSFANRVGSPGLANLISSNNFGIFIADTSTSNNIVQSNLIGTGNGGNTNLGNRADGIYFVNGTLNNQIGGTGVNEGNLIAYNRSGIRADSGVRNAFLRNRIFSNVGLGIDLGGDGVTLNDSADVDSGPNNLQNFPVITYVNAQLGGVNIQGTFDSTPNRTFTFDFFGNDNRDASNYGEGRYYLGSTQVTTNSGGRAAFNTTLPASLSQVSTWVTATATDGQNNTSEFSLARNICSDMTLSPSSVIAFSNGGSTTFNVNISAGCNYSVRSNVPWISAGSVTGNIAAITIGVNPSAQRTGAVGIFFNNGELNTFTNFTVFQNGGARLTNFDYDSDGKSDVSVFRPSNNSWYINRSTTGFAGYQFGAPGDVIVPADYTGDGKTDIAIWRPSNGNWYILRSENSTLLFGGAFGQNGDVPVPADYDGDGRADFAVFRPGAPAYWYLQQTTNGFGAIPFGMTGDVPALGDFDGDGKSDISVFRPSLGQWFRFNSRDGSFYGVQFGQSGDKIVQADYTGDGKTDCAVFRPSNNTWYILRSETPTFYAAGFGLAGDLPAPGDYDGDGKTDIAVWRPGAQGNFYIQQSTAGFNTIPWGLTGDRPTENAYVY